MKNKLIIAICLIIVSGCNQKVTYFINVKDVIGLFFLGFFILVMGLLFVILKISDIIERRKRLFKRK